MYCACLFYCKDGTLIYKYFLNYTSFSGAAPLVIAATDVFLWGKACSLNTKLVVPLLLIFIISLTANVRGTVPLKTVADMIHSRLQRDRAASQAESHLSLCPLSLPAV